MTDYPQWVRERACELANAKEGSDIWSPNDIDDYLGFQVIADLILKYETAPVDPDEALICEAIRMHAPVLNIQTDACIKSIMSGAYTIACTAIKLARERNAL